MIGIYATNSYCKVFSKYCLMGKTGKGYDALLQKNKRLFAKHSGCKTPIGFKLCWKIWSH